MDIYFFYSLFTNSILTIASFLSAMVCISYLSTLIKTKKIAEISFLSDGLFNNLTIQQRKSIVILIHVLFLVSALLCSSFFTTNLLKYDDLRAMPDGEYCYYVKATNEKNSTYTLPAKIYKDNNHYQVTNVYFKNGGYLYLDDSCQDITFYETGYAIDQSDKEWEIQLTPYKSHNENVDVTKYSLSINDILCLSMIFLHFIVIILHIIHFKKSKSFTNGE